MDWIPLEIKTKTRVWSGQFNLRVGVELEGSGERETRKEEKPICEGVIRAKPCWYFLKSVQNANQVFLAVPLDLWDPSCLTSDQIRAPLK